MNKLLYTLFAIVILQLQATAQTTPQFEHQAAITKIADVLSHQPAVNEQKSDEAMRKLDAFQESVITMLLKQLVPPGTGNNSKIEYATNSYSLYVLQPGKEAQRAKFVRGLIDALDEIEDKDNKSYVISLLQNAGKDDAVAALTPYLRDGFLSDGAARALATIGSEAASIALLSELTGADGRARLPVIEALGTTRYAGAEAALLNLVGRESAAIQKAVLSALAEIAGTASFKALKDAAHKVNYDYDVTNASASYQHYATRLVENGEHKLAEKIAKGLLKGASEDDQVHLRINALGLLTQLNGEKYTGQLVKAAHDENREYRISALTFAAPYIGEANVGQWVRGLRKADAETRADMIAFLSAGPAQTAIIPELKKSLDSHSATERAAAVIALAKVTGDQSAPVLLELLAKGDEADRQVIKNAFLTMKGDELPALLMKALPEASPANKVVIIDLLASRSYEDSFSAIQMALNDKDVAVRNAAYCALSQVARSEDLPVLTTLINNSGDEYEKAVQQAVINVVTYSTDKERDVDFILTYYQGLSEQQKTHAIHMLSGIGGKKALQIASPALNSGNTGLKDAAVVAIANWKDENALQYLIDFSKDGARTKHLDTILTGLIRITAAADITDEKKVLIYRDAMEVARTVPQKISILKNLEECKTYNAMMFAGTLLNDSDLREAAATTVMNIALDRKGFYGNDVSILLDTVFTIVNRRQYLGEAIEKHVAELPKGPGYVSLFNGKDLTGWKGLVADPIKRAAMSEKELVEAQQKADEEMRQAWSVEDGVLLFNGKGNNLATVKQYGDFEMLVDWKLDKDGKDGDAGIYLRGTPQVQIWDTSRTDVGAQVGSGGLYNNKTHPDKPLKVADNPLGEWNTFRIKMVGEKVTVYLNGELVVDNVPLENYWDRNQSIFPVEQIELQAHGTTVYYRDIFIKELPRKEIFTLSEQEKKEGFRVLFDGTNMDAWTGNTTSYTITDEGTLAIIPKKGTGGNLYSKEEFSDFIYRLEFRLTHRANNGIGLRAPLTGNASFLGMEVAILDDDHEVYKNLAPWQYNGSIYGVIPAKRGYLSPVGEWNKLEIYLKGNDVKVTLNGTDVLEGNLAEASKNGTVDGKDHPGLKEKSGHLGFLGHGSEVHFKNIRIKEL